jgi:alpha-galactosidase
VHHSVGACACLIVAALLPALGLSSAARSVERHAQFADAFVEFDHSSGEWTIGNDAVRYSVAVTRQGSLRSVALRIAGSSQPVTASRVTDTTVTVEDDVLALGDPESKFLVTGVSGSTGSHFVSLAIRFASASRGLAATRYYVVYPGAGAVEAWTSIETLDGTARTVRDLNALHLTVAASDIDYVGGLDTPGEAGGPFSRQRRTLAPGERLSVGSPTLSSEETLPFFSIDAGDYRVYGGLAWSGAWSADFVRGEDALTVSMGLPPMSAVARPGQPVEGPHVFVGAARAGTGDDVAAVTRFVRESRAGRPFPSLTTFNTWFVHGINIDEAVARRDIDYASSIGLELFQLDAGWYMRARPQHSFDFTDGLGSWEVDRSRFPSGLAALAAYARAHGMQFGVWVEPERVDLATVGQSGMADESFLARQHDAYEPGRPNGEARDGQICLAYPPAREWVRNKLFAFLDGVGPDNLKWDVNRWVHCTRTDHGHPVDGGNYEHVRALYELLAEVRTRYPAMSVENCAGGGHRMDFGIARLTDTAWMDDRSAPSAHVRRNLNGLLALFPASYLFSYVMPHSSEPLQGAVDLPLTVRSRMPGVVGLAALLDGLTEGELNVLHQEFELAKRLRGVQHNAVTYALTPQRNGDGDWEVIQQWIPESSTSYLFAFAERASGSIRVRPFGLQPDVTYELRSAERGTIGRIDGADLMAHGLEIHEAPESAAQILVLAPLLP